MRNLALRFVKSLPNLSTTETAVHVVDPVVDLRKLFERPNFLKNELEKRKINKNIDEISKKYEKWWNLYEMFENSEKEDMEKIKEIKLKMMEKEEGLIEALKLPNFIETKHFLDYEKNFIKIHGFEIEKSMMKTSDFLEKSIFESFKIIRIDPPRMVRPAISEAFNYSENEIIRFHEGNNPAMNLIGISPPGLIVSFVSTKFSNSNNFPLIFLAKGAGYNRKYFEWQKQFVSMIIFENDKQNLGKILANFSEFFKYLFDAEITKVLPENLKNYESNAAKLIKNGEIIGRISSTGTFLSERLKILAEHGNFLEIGFVEIDISNLMKTKN